jgi:hypothetical protein
MMSMAKDNPKPALAHKPVRKSKFQADLAPAEDSMVRALKTELQLTSNTDFFSDALTLFRWAVTVTGERQVLVFPRLERVAPDLVLPQVNIRWTQAELESLATLATGQHADPTDALIRAMR